MENFVLMIWQLIPDEIDLYKLPENHELIQKVLACHNKYVDNDISEDLDDVMEAMRDGVFSAYLLHNKAEPSEDVGFIKTIVVTGQIL